MQRTAAKESPPRRRRPRIGIIIVDHGSRRPEANAMLLDVVAAYAAQSRYKIVEPAHMELAEPSIATAFDKAVSRGAGQVVVMPYFLLPGRHWLLDIPRLTAAAARKHPGVSFLVTEPLALHALINRIIDDRIQAALKD